MKTIVIIIPRPSLKIFEFYAGEFGLSVKLLMESECCSEIITLLDAPLQTLERIEGKPTPQNLEIVSLEFTPEAYSFLSRISELLRRPLDDLMGAVLVESAEIIGYNLKESPQLKGGAPDSALKSWADSAKDFQLRSQKNLSPSLVQGFDCWDWCGIKNPAAAPAPMGGMESVAASA